jgi:hypothetical protein
VEGGTAIEVDGIDGCVTDGKSGRVEDESIHPADDGALGEGGQSSEKDR